jgi:hypothetical protein
VFQTRSLPKMKVHEKTPGPVRLESESRISSVFVAARMGPKVHQLLRKEDVYRVLPLIRSGKERLLDPTCECKV